MQVHVPWSAGTVPVEIDEARVAGVLGASVGRAADPEGFVVSGKFGPLRDGELARARAWGTRLAAAVEAASAGVDTPAV